jgi:hypothetical protein
MKTRISGQRIQTTFALVCLCTAWGAAQQAVPRGAKQDPPSLAFAQAISPHDAARHAPAQEEPDAADGETQSGGIKVHGHWVLEVKNPDGKLADRREFDNSLVTGGKYVSGDQLLAAMLSGDLVSGGFGVALITGNIAGQDPTGLCQLIYPVKEQPAPSGIGCYGLDAFNFVGFAYQSNPSGPQWPYSAGLQFATNYQNGLRTSVSFAPSVSILLQGSYTVGCVVNPPDGQPPCGGTMPPITAVQSFMAGCAVQAPKFGTSTSGENAGTIFPNTRLTGTSLPIEPSTELPMLCNGDWINHEHVPTATIVLGVLTSASLPRGPMAVTSGQVITISVTISFSS